MIGTSIEARRAVMAYYNGVCMGAQPSPTCGCGTPEESWLFVGEVLVAIEGRKLMTLDHKMPRGALALVVHLLDDMGLVEHGGSWYGCWLTPLGQAVADALRTATVLDMGAAVDDEELVGCYGSGCPNCARIAPLVALAGGGR